MLPKRQFGAILKLSKVVISRANNKVEIAGTQKENKTREQRVWQKEQIQEGRQIGQG